MKSMPFAIGVFVSSDLIGKELERIGTEQEDIFRLSYTSLEAAIAIGLQMEAEGVEAIVSRRGTAHLLRENLSIPVLSFPQSSLSTLTSIKMAADRLAGTSTEKKIFMPNFRSNISGLEMVAELLPIHFMQDVYFDSASLRRIIFAAAEQGFEIVIGGSTSMRYAEECGLKFQELLTPHESIVETLENAKSAVQASREEKATAQRYQSIMDLSSDGIFSVDATGNLTSINKKARDILGIIGLDPIQQPAAAVLNNKVVCRLLEDKKVVQEKIEKFGKELCVYNQVPLTVEGQAVGAVATFKEINTVMRAESKVRRSLTKGFSTRYTFADIIYQSPAMEHLIGLSMKLAETDSTVFVIGETGTGKELLAQSIHNAGRRRKMPFVSVHCGALPEQLLESELFGYEEGAFTGSKKGGKPGLFELAHQGTIFLDEIDSTSLNVQLRLLGVLQEKEVMRIGGEHKTPVDVRIIAAAGKNLWSVMQAGLFRKDLFFRLNVLRITIPPLRERAGDVPLLMEYFLNYHADRHGMEPYALPASYLDKLNQYPWPGNVRQIRHFAEQVQLSNSFDLGPESLDSLFDDLQQIAEVLGVGNAAQAFAETDASVVGQQGDRPAQPGEPPARLELRPEMQVEKQSRDEVILKALRENQYSKAETARVLGISRTTLWRKLKEIDRRSKGKKA